MSFLVIYEPRTCPIVDCINHKKIIKCSEKELEDHLFFDHGYHTKKERAEQLGIIGIGQYGVTARELAHALAKEGIVNE